MNTPADEPTSNPLHPAAFPLEPAGPWRVWGLLLLVLLVCLPPMLVSLSVPDVTSTMEKISLLSSRETWAAQSGGDTDAWLMPTWNGRPRLNKPPMLVWLHLLVWSDLDPVTASSDMLVFRARLLAVGLTLLALAGTYWAGYTLGGLRCAAMAALAAGTTLLVLKQSRLASYDTHLLAWVTLAAAGGLWAIRPLHPDAPTPRRIIGWAVAGLALGLAVLSKGPVAIPFFFVPLAGAIILSPPRRLGNVAGLLLALLLAGVIALPWYVYVVQAHADALQGMKAEYQASRATRQPFWIYVNLLYLVFPWTLFLVAAMFQPFVRASGSHRRRTLVAWVWFVGVLVVLCVPSAKHARYALPLIPAAGILVGQLWSYHAWLAVQGLQDPGVGRLRNPHWIILLVAAVVLPLFILLQPTIAEWLEWKHLALPGLPWYVTASMGLLLVVIAAYGFRQHVKWKPTPAFAATALWLIILMTGVYYSYARSSSSRYAYRADAERLRAVIGDEPFFYFYDPRYDPTEKQKGSVNFEPEEEFLFYIGRRIPPMPIDQLTEYADQPFYLMVRLIEQGNNLEHLTALGFEPVFDFKDHRRIGAVRPDSRLFRSPALTAMQTRRGSP